MAQGDPDILGWHVIVDGYDARPEELEDAARVHATLLALAERLGLTAVGSPVVHATADGVAGILLVSESHVSLHTSVAARRVWADVFSCRPFDADAAVALLSERYNFARHTVRRLERGG